VILATLRTITGRKGSFRGGTAVVLAGVTIVIVVLIVLHALRPGRNPSIGGQPMLDGVGGVIWFLGTVVGILIGSLAGSYDVAQGTMRYLVITGARRSQIYAARTVALVLAVSMMLAVPLVLGCLAAILLPHTHADAVSAGELADFLWTNLVFVVVFSLISMGIGSLMRSNGPAIAISLVFSLGFTPLLLLLYAVSRTLGDLTLISSLDRITGGDEQHLSIPVSALAVVAWVALFWGIGALRVQRDEY
jgi:ABC-type transport system involved in multi-copper enzyme maturation permease subunit